MGAEPRVLVLTPDFPPAAGGIQLLVGRLVQHSTRLRPRVLTVDAAGAGAFDDANGLDVRRVRRVGGQRLTMGRLNVSAVAQALGFRPAAVLSAHIVTAPAAAVIGRVLRVPVIQYLYAEELGARPALATFAVRRADAAIAVSRYTRELALAAGGDPGSVHIIPPGVDLPQEHHGDQRAARPTLLTVARLSERYKGHDVVLRALPLIRARVPDVEWVVIGDGPLRRRLQRAADEQGLQRAVRFIGTASDAERDRWLDLAHVFIMPSRVPAGGFAGEGFGIVYLEAGAHGLPVLAGNQGGALDAVRDGVTGALVDPTNHVALADAASDLLLDPDRARALGAAGARHARGFAWPVMARRVEDLVLRLINSAGPSAPAQSAATTRTSR